MSKLRYAPSVFFLAATAFLAVAAFLAATPAMTLSSLACGAEPAPAGKDKTRPPSVDEARARAQLLHESLHATLHIVHLDLYREDEGLPIPAASLKKVFREVARSRDVKLRWLAVDGQVMNTDHNPQTDFERQAVTALAGGKTQHERVENGTYHYAGAITLSADCLKCHVPNRTDTKDRTAGLLISMPVAGE